MDKRKALKYVGNIFMVLALCFLVYKLTNLDIDYEQLMKIDNLLKIIILSFAYAVTTYVACIPWRKVISILAGENISFSNANLIWNKSNLMKYIPGNVFQYIGRNELAIIENVNHADVALATVMDVLLNLAGFFLAACITYFSGIKIGLAIIGQQKKYIIVVVVMIILILVFAFLVRKKISNFWNSIKLLFKVKNVMYLCLLILFYALVAIYTGTIYILILTYIMGINVEIMHIPTYLGAFLLSWIVGFVVPGAPGGIGIREMVFTLLLEAYGSVDIDSMLLAIVIYRFVSILGELIGLTLSMITKKLVTKDRIKHEETNGI